MQTALRARMPEINIVDVLSETDRWTKRYHNHHLREHQELGEEYDS